MKYRAVVFDLDGTLLNTLEDLHASCNYALEQAGARPRSLEEVRRFVGNGVARLIEQCLPEGCADPRYEQALTIMREHYRTHNRIRTAPYSGVAELIAALAARGIAMAVVSNKPDSSVKPLVRDYFHGKIPVAIGERAGVRRKPAPDAVEEALRALGRDREETVYVGDSEVDLATARAAGLECVCVTWGFRDKATLEAAGGSHFIDAPAELLEWF